MIYCLTLGLLKLKPSSSPRWPRAGTELFGSGKLYLPMKHLETRFTVWQDSGKGNRSTLLFLNTIRRGESSSQGAFPWTGWTCLILKVYQTAFHLMVKESFQLNRSGSNTNVCVCVCVCVYIYIHTHRYPLAFRFFSHIGHYRVLSRVHITIYKIDN